MPADSSWIPPNVSELNMDACGFVDRECESIWGSPGAEWTSYVRPLFLPSFPNINSCAVTQPMLLGPAFCGSTVWTQRVWTGQPRLLKMDRKMFYFFFFQGPNPQSIPIILNFEHSNWCISDRIWTERDATDVQSLIKSPQNKCLNIHSAFCFWQCNL